MKQHLAITADALEDLARQQPELFSPVTRLRNG